MESRIKKDYTEKIKEKLLGNIVNKDEAASDFNNFIILMNYCFVNKNNFFVDNFNHKILILIVTTYNRIKTNILTKEITDLFDSVSLDGLKSTRFIITNMINNYKEIKENNEELCELVSKNSLKRCLILFNDAINVRKT